MPTEFPVYNLSIPGPKFTVATFVRIAHQKTYGYRMIVKEGPKIVATVHADPSGRMDVRWGPRRLRQDLAAVASLFPSHKGAYPDLSMNEYRFLAELAAHEYLRRRLNKVSLTHSVLVPAGKSLAHEWIQISHAQHKNANFINQKYGAGTYYWVRNQGWEITN